MDLMGNSSRGSDKVFSTPIKTLSDEQISSLKKKISRESPRFYKSKFVTEASGHSGGSNGFSNIQRFENGETAGPKSLFQNVFIDKDLLISKNTKSKFSESIQEKAKTQNAFSVTKKNISDSDQLESNRSTDFFNRSINTNSTHLQNFSSENESIDLDTIEILTSEELKMKKLGSYENPILSKLSKRTINKESEIQKLMINMLFLFVGNLMLKFSNLFINHTNYGLHIVSEFQFIYRNLVAKYVANGTFLHILIKAIFENQEVFTFFRYFIESICIINMVVAFSRIATRVKVDDLKMTEKQRILLGLKTNNDSKQDDDFMQKPHLVSSTDEKNDATNNSKEPLYLFKALKTPLAIKEKKAQKTNMSRSNDQFGNFRKSVLVDSLINQTSVRTKYTPSNKYAYLMDSPSSKRRL